jgi:glycosyltransferase involved in cell wall biosynthesis
VSSPPVPSLSVIVTSYNIEAYIGACLDSVVGQTLADMEIIVVDDGSTDATPDIIRARAARDPRIVPVLLDQNSVGGVATAANAGMDRATGEYVGFADGDDLYDPAMFEALLGAARLHDADLAMCQYVLLDDGDGSVRAPGDARRWDELDRSVYDLDVPTSRQFLRFIAVPWRKVYRRTVLEDNDLRFPVGDWFYEDNPFHWFAILSSESIAVVPEVLCQHRVGRTGQTMATVDARLFKMFVHHETIHAWLVDRGLEPTYRSTLLGWAMSQAQWIGRRTPPELRAELFAHLRTVHAHYDAHDVEQAIVEGQRGLAARELSTAVLADDFAAFCAALDRAGEPASPVARLAHHLRRDGVRDTASRVARAARHRLGRAPRRS